jgi:hypothetical protein
LVRSKRECDEQGAPAMIDDEARRGCCEKLGVYKLVGTAR